MENERGSISDSGGTRGPRVGREAKRGKAGRALASLLRLARGLGGRPGRVPQPSALTGVVPPRSDASGPTGAAVLFIPESISFPVEEPCVWKYGVCTECGKPRGIACEPSTGQSVLVCSSCGTVES